MKERIFREKSMKRVSSPEQLDDYIKVTSPGMWMVLAALLLLLAGVCVWGIFGRLDTVLTVPAVVKNGTLFCYIKEEDREQAAAGMQIEVKGEVCSIHAISGEPVEASGVLTSYAMHIGGLEAGQWVYTAEAYTQLADGIYEAEVVVERIAPAAFLFP